MASTEKAPLAIIGGGLAGLTLSLGLARQGIPHNIYESAKLFSEIGAGIALGPNSVTALELIDPNITEALRRCITYNQDLETDVEGEVHANHPNRSDWLDFRVGMEKGFGTLVTTVKYRGAGKAGRACLHRARFLEELSMLIPDTTTTFGKTLVSIDEPASRNSQDPLLLTFSDGTTVEASAVVACDGIKSPSRSKYVLVGADSALLRPCPSEEFAYRGVYTQEEFNKITNGTISSTSGTLWCGKDAYVVMYPIEKGHFMNMVCVRRYLPISEDFKPPSSADKSWVQPVDHDTMMADFASWGAPIRALLSEIKRPERWFLFDHLPAPTFVKDRVALVGDAAHATTPHQGQGAGMAFEDSLVLSNILGSLYDSSHSPGLSAASIEAAFHAYDLVRRPRSLELVRSSREMGLIVEYGSEDIGEDLSKLKTELDTRMSWIWDIDLKGEIRKGIEIAGNYAG